MIRINLLVVERQRTKERSSAGIGAQQLAIICCAILVVTAGLIGWWYWSLHRDAERFETEIARARQETLRLQSVLQQVQQFEARKGQLQQRVTLIEQLRKGQSGPVHMLDEISRSLPEMLWLTEMKQKGTELTIEGRASSLTSLSDFIGNLEQSKYFRKPVEILSSQLDPQPQGDLVRFSVKAQFVAPGG